MQLEISLLRSDECFDLEEFLVMVFSETYRENAQKFLEIMFSQEWSRPCFIVGRLSGKIIAATAISEEWFSTDIWGLSWVSVHPNHRHQKIGEQIVGAALNEIRSRIKKPSTAILSTLEGQSKLYERLGFAGTTLDHEHGFIMTKTVEPLIIQQ